MSGKMFGWAIDRARALRRMHRAWKFRRKMQRNEYSRCNESLGLRAYEAGTLLVLLAMADWANDDGGHIFPRIETLAKKARLSERGTQYALARLKRDGTLEQTSPARQHRPAEYRIVLEKLGCSICTPEARGAIGDNPGVQSATPGVQSTTAYIDEPLQEPSKGTVISRAKGEKEEDERDSRKERPSPSEPDPKAWAPEVMKAYRAIPNADHAASEELARKAWAALLE